MRRWSRRLRALLRKDAVERELDEELAFHLELETEKYLRAGLSPAEARRRAALAFGGVERHKEEVRDARWLAWAPGLSLDFKLGLRMLRKYPGLTLVAVLALSVAVGGGAGYLELLNDVYRPTLPFEHGDRVVGILNWNVAKGEPNDRSLHDFLTWREDLQSVEDLGAFEPLERNLTTNDGRTEPIRAVRISASAFRLTGVTPLLGRPLLGEDERAGAPPVVLLGHALWESRFGGDSGVVGRTVRLGGTPHTVVGVMPRGFGFPVNHSLWVPLRLSRSDYERGQGPSIKIFGRLAPGAEFDEAQAELTAIGLRAAADFPATNRHLRPRIKPYVESLVLSGGDSVAEMRILYALNLFFLGLLGVCGANVATLVFARVATREGEITVRTALGASRGRIAAQLFAEALVLASAAAVVGLAAAAFGLRWVKGIILSAGVGLPFWWRDGLSLETLLYGGALTVIAALMVGVVPALKATGPRLQARLKYAAAGGPSMTFGRLWTGVIVSQVALTVVFLLIVASFGWNVRVARYGAPEAAFPAREYLAARLEMDREGTPGALADTAEWDFRARFRSACRELERRLAAERGVVGVTYGSRLPRMGHPGLSIEVDGATAPGIGAARRVRTATVAVDFFGTFGAPILAGRAFDQRDVEPDRHVAIVDQTFVDKVLGGRSAVGRRVRQAAATRGEKPGAWYEIVGVVRDLTVGPDKSAEDAVLYRPAAPGGADAIHMAVHVNGDPKLLAPRIRSVAASVDPALRLYDLVPFDEIDRADRLATGFFIRVLAVVGSIALLLSTAGVYSLMSFTVARRTREIGIRAALGAAPRRVVTEILSRAFAQVGLGIVAGSLPGSALVAWGVPEGAQGAGLTAGVAALAAAVAFMAGVGLLASTVPARRALRVQPTEALRVE